MRTQGTRQDRQRCEGRAGESRQLPAGEIRELPRSGNGVRCRALVKDMRFALTPARGTPG